MSEGPDEDGRDLAAEVLEAIRSRAPERPTPQDRAASWRWLWMTAAAVMAAAALFAVSIGALEPSPSGCSEEEGWAYVWLMFSPIVAAVSVVVPGVIASFAAPWAAPLRIGRLLVVAGVGVWVGGYFVGSALEVGCVTSNVAWGTVTIVLPAVLGTALVLWTVRRRQGARRRRRA